VLQSNAGSLPQDVMSAVKPTLKVMATKRNVFFIDENIEKVEIMRWMKNHVISKKFGKTMEQSTELNFPNYPKI
jgi:hypothetical protein